MDLRLARPTDVPLVLSLAFAEDSHLIKDPNWPASGTLRHVRRSLTRAALPFAFTGRSWLARDGRNVAWLEMEPRAYLIGWDIMRLAARGEPGLIEPLLRVALADAQRKGVPRLFARGPAGDTQKLQAHGFHCLAREYLLVGPESSPAEAPLPPDGRYRAPQDAWPLHQLESELTPALVRQLEGLSSMDWMPARKGMEVVVERDMKIVAWLGWGPAGQPSPLGLMVHPDHGDAGRALLAHALARLGTSRPEARVREYQTETLAALQDAGFTIVNEQVVMVKHGRFEYAREEVRRGVHARIPGIRAFELVPVGKGPRAGTAPVSMRPEDAFLRPGRCGDPNAAPGFGVRPLPRAFAASHTKDRLPCL